jgi:hypothetical protein
MGGRACDQSGDMLVTSETQDIVIRIVASSSAATGAKLSVNSRLNLYLSVFNKKNTCHEIIKKS